MRRFKEWDLVLQTLFLVLYVVALFAGDRLVQVVTALACLGWQLVSLLVHHARHWFTRKHLYRAKFGNSILLLILSTLFGIIAQISSVFVLFAIPMLVACGYLCICITEVHLLLKRPLSYLK